MIKTHLIAAGFLAALTTAAGATAAGAAAAGAAASGEAGDVMHGVHTEPHVISHKSVHDFETTLANLIAAIDARGFTTFAVIDHAKGAASVDAALRPTTLVIFGNPKGGAPLMQAAQTIGIALPLKALVYENAAGETIIATTDIHHVLKEHGVADKTALGKRIADALAAIAGGAGR